MLADTTPPDGLPESIPARLPEPIPARRAEPADLLARAAAGEPGAVRELLDEVGPVVFGFVFARVGGRSDAAEDITQETLIEACRGAHTFRGDAAVTTWVCAIARRRVARYFEQERRQDVMRAGLSLVAADHGADGEDSAHGPGADDGGLGDVERSDEVVRALGRLPVAHRQVLVLKYLDERSVAEIADELGRNRVQVQSLLQRARDGLRRELGANR